jgi:thiol:disulfide interchange protein DsbD
LTPLAAGAAVLLEPLAAQADGFGNAVARGTGAAFLFAFTAGVLTALTPCVYPMIPITLSVFGARNAPRPRAMLLATLYVAGIAVMFGALGTTSALLGKAFGTFLANPWVIVPLAGFFALMAASMFGAFDLAVPPALLNRLTEFGGKGYSGAFLMGLVAGLIAAPCTGPPLAGMLAYVATTRDGVRGFLLMATYATGIGLPFWAIAGFSMSLPRPGRWLEAVKSVFGIALLLASLYYLKNVVPPLAHVTGHSRGFLAGALGLAVVGVALGAVTLSFYERRSRQVRKALGIGLVVLGLFGSVNYLLTPKTELGWLHTEEEAVRVARAEGKPLLVDFMADWCLPCKEMELKVFSRPDVAKALQGFVLLRVDLSREGDDDSLPQLKERYGVRTLPAVRVVSRAGQIVGGVDDLVEPPAFLRALSNTGS